MKTLYIKPGYYKLVDNEQDFDFVGWIENFTTATLIAIFESGDYEYDEEADEIVWDEDDWNLDQLVFAENVGAVNGFREYTKLNDLHIIEIAPKKWGGFLADNEGRSMFNALRKALCK